MLHRSVFLLVIATITMLGLACQSNEQAASTATPATAAKSAAATATPTVIHGGTVKVGQIRKPENFDPMTNSYSGESAMLGLIYDSI